MYHVLSPCGVDCSLDCRAFGVECTGCRQQEGRVPWIGFIEKSACPVYFCSVVEKQQISCVGCAALPCALFDEIKNPSISAQQHTENLKKQVMRLREEALATE